MSTPSIKLWIKWGTKYENKLPMIKAKYLFEGSINGSVFVKLLTNERRNWDDTVTIYEEIQVVSPEISVIHYATKPPVFFMKAKDFAEKMIRLERNGVYYGYHGTIPEHAFPAIDKYQRCETVFSGNILKKENETWVYYTFSQMNLNVRYILQI